MKISRDFLKFKICYDRVIGALTAIPFAYPKEPLYWLSMLVFLLALPRLRLNGEGQKYISFLLLFIAVVILANITSSYAELIYPFSIVGTIFTLLFFLLRFCIRDYDEFIKGYLFVISIYIVLTFIAFFVLKPYLFGFNFFINSHYRMWAEGYLIEWPNVFCVMLLMGAFLFWFQGKNIWFFLAVLAAVLTTSRMALLAIALIALYYGSRRWTIAKLCLFLVTALFSIVAYCYLQGGSEFTHYVNDRLFKISDRALIFETLKSIYVENFFGVGNVTFAKINDVYESYHSSVFKVLIRYGFLGLLLYIAIIMPKKPLYKLSSKENIPLLFLLLVGVVQDMLFHIHIVMMYSIFLALREKHLFKEA